MMNNQQSNLLERAKVLKLAGLIAHWDELADVNWPAKLINWEELERSQKSLDRRLKSARLGRFKPLAEFDWSWPDECERDTIEKWLQLSFIKDATNLLLCGPNGVGKSTIACNIGKEAVLKGYTVLFTTAANMLNDLAAIDSDSSLRRRIRHYTKPQLLIIDEVGYLAYSDRHADLLFEIISQRYEKHATMITTNKPFGQWNDIFPNAACVVSLIDRLVHHSELVNVKAASFRLKEATERNNKRLAERAKQKSDVKKSIEPDKK